MKQKKYELADYTQKDPYIIHIIAWWKLRSPFKTIHEKYKTEKNHTN